MSRIVDESVTTTAHPTPAAEFDPSVKRKKSFSESGCCGPYGWYGSSIISECGSG